MISANRFITFIITCSLLVSGTSLFAQSEESKRLISLEKRRFELLIRRDTTQLSALLADSLIYIHSSGIIDNKVSYLKDVGSGRIIYQFYIPEKVTVKVEGGFAWIYGRANVRFRLASMTGNIDQYISFVEVYRLKGYQWQLIMCQNARIESDAPYTNILVPQVKAGSVPSIY